LKARYWLYEVKGFAPLVRELGGRKVGVFYVTTPIYYPNDKPHIGHAYTTIMADVLARWHRLKGDEVFFLTGTDEHGLKLQREAEKRGLDPKRFVDEMSEVFKRYWSLLDISYDRFIRTTDEDHVETVKKALMKIYSKGLIYRGTYRGLYCVSCEKFYSEGEYIEENGKKLCPIHRKELENLEEETYFLKLSAYEDYVKELLTKDIVYPRSYAKEVLSKISREGLRDLSITRPRNRVYWGIEAPWDPQHTVYVWIDALLNYISALSYGSDESRIAKFWPAVHHIIGKDILWFHTAIWFALLAMLDLPPPRKVIIHAFITLRGLKMGKSAGNIVSIDELVARYGGADPVRYLLMRFSSLEKDVEFSTEQLDNAFNSELADTFGNLVRRAGVLVLKKLGGSVEGGPEMVDTELSSRVRESVERVFRAMDEFRFSEALIAIFDIYREANAYLNKTEPWRLEDPRKPLYNVLECIRIATTLLYPFMPKTSMVVAKSLGFEIEGIERLSVGDWHRYNVSEAPILFKKIR